MMSEIVTIKSANGVWYQSQELGKRPIGRVLAG